MGHRKIFLGQAGLASTAPLRSAAAVEGWGEGREDIWACGKRKPSLDPGNKLDSFYSDSDLVCPYLI